MYTRLKVSEKQIMVMQEFETLATLAGAILGGNKDKNSPHPKADEVIEVTNKTQLQGILNQLKG